MNSKYDLLAGDSLVSAGMVAYSGPFTSGFRADLESLWVQALDDLNISHTQNIKMTSFLGD